MLPEERIRATSRDELEAVTDVIHDCFFEVDEISFDVETGVLTIPFLKPVEPSEPSERRERGRRAVSLRDATLRFSNVVDWKLRDTQKVGLYDFNRLNWKPRSSRIIVKTGIPLRLEVAVSGIEVEVTVAEWGAE